MPAMTMPFAVRDTNLTRGLKPGDTIAFDLTVTPKEGWIDHIVKLDSPAHVTTPPPQVHSAPVMEALTEGDMLPDYQFTNELGEPVRLSQFQGHVVVLTFFFTSCPYPDFCPRMTSNFARAAEELRHINNAAFAWQLLSISFDPASDTPQRLRSYALGVPYDPRHWSFLTGDERQISRLAAQMGEIYRREGTTISHNLHTIVVDPRGRIRNILPGNQWTPEQLVEAMLQAGGQSAGKSASCQESVGSFAMNRQ
jgi:protein SCO1